MVALDEYSPWEALAEDKQFWDDFQRELETALTERMLPIFMAGAYAGSRLLPKRLRPEGLEEKHYSGLHDQMTHAHGGFGSPAIGPVTARQQANAEKWLAANGVSREGIEANAESFLKGATSSQRKAGMGWYDDAHDYATDLAAKHGVSIQTASGVLAACSPRSRWSLNKESADSVLRLSKGKFVGGAVSVGNVTGKNLEKALKIARGADAEKTLGGCKVRSFYHNILEPRASRETTIDTHMINVLAGGGRPMGDKFCASVFNKPAVYSVFKSTLDKVAERHGIRHSQAQAIIWTEQVDSLGAGAKAMFRVKADDYEEPEDGTGLFAGGDEALTDIEYLNLLEHDMRERGETEEAIREALGNVVLYSTGRTLTNKEKHLAGRHDQMTHAHGGGLGESNFADEVTSGRWKKQAEGKAWASMTSTERETMQDWVANANGAKFIQETARHTEGGLLSYVPGSMRREAELEAEIRAEHMSSVIQKSPPLAGNLTVYRGLNCSKERVDSLQVGAKYYDRGFTSVSPHERQAQKFLINYTMSAGPEKVLLKINLKKGTRAYPTDGKTNPRVREVNNVSEMILDRGFRATVVGRRERGISGRDDWGERVDYLITEITLEPD
jgi:hypothetical protein